MNELEKNIRDAFALLIYDREHVQVSKQDLLTLCRSSPSYALNFIDKNKTPLIWHDGKCRKKIADLVRSVEWELRGASEFIECYLIDDFEYVVFIQERLSISPEKFTREDLLAILGHFQDDKIPIRVLALKILSNNVASFAARMASEPPGMSHDLESLKRSIQNYSFNPDLNEILQKIDNELQQEDSDAFDQVATMRHIRSFFEKLHEEIGKELQRCKPEVGNGTPLERFGKAIEYLERKQVITDKLKQLARSIYAILSDDKYGVHSLKASRDYTRLCRNIVIEYAVTLFFELDRRLIEPGDS